MYYCYLTNKRSLSITKQYKKFNLPVCVCSISLRARATRHFEYLQDGRLLPYQSIDNIHFCSLLAARSIFLSHFKI